MAPYLYNTFHSGEGCLYYTINVARLLSSNSSLGLSILSDLFDPYAELFIAELKRTYSISTIEQIHWGFDFLVWLMCNTFAEVDRIKFLSHDICSIGNPEIACQYLYHYLIAGLHAGHIRIGMEDNIYYAKSKLAKSNTQFVERAVQIIQKARKQPASPDQARKILNLN